MNLLVLALVVFQIIQKVFSLKPNNFTQITLGANQTEEELEIKNTGIFTLIIPGTIFSPKDVADCKEGNLKVVIDSKEHWVFPGHNSYIIPDGKHKVTFKVNSKSIFSGKNAFWTYTDEVNATYPYFPGYDWVTYNMNDTKTHIRILPELKDKDEYVMTFGFFNNTGTHLSMIGRFNKVE